MSRTQRHLDVFWIGPDGALMTTWWDEETNVWPAPRPITAAGAGAPGCPISALSRSENAIDVFWIDPEGGVRSVNWTYGRRHLDNPFDEVNNTVPEWWSDTYLLAKAQHADLGAGVVALTRDGTAMDVFWIARDSSIKRRSWRRWLERGTPVDVRTGWQGRTPTTVAPAGSAAAGGAGGLSAATTDVNTIWLVWVDPAGQVTSTRWTDVELDVMFGPAEVDLGWTAPRRVGTQGRRPIGVGACVARSPGHLDIFWAKDDGTISSTMWDKHWPADGWYPGELQAADTAATQRGTTVAAVSRFMSRLDLAWITHDGRVRYTWWDEYRTDGDWASHRPIDVVNPGHADVHSTPAVINRYPRTVDVIWVGADGSINQNSWNGRPPEQPQFAAAQVIAPAGSL